MGKEMRLILSGLSDYEIGVKWKMFTPLIVYFTCTKILERVKTAYKRDKNWIAVLFLSLSTFDFPPPFFFWLEKKGGRKQAEEEMWGVERYETCYDHRIKFLKPIRYFISLWKRKTFNGSHFSKIAKVLPGLQHLSRIWILLWLCVIT